MTNKIDINKQYKTRSGLLVMIYAVDVDAYKKQRVYGACILNAGSVSMLWDKYGRYNIDTQDDHFLDLIEIVE